jgi:hypothetical protein
MQPVLPESTGSSRQRSRARCRYYAGCWKLGSWLLRSPGGYRKKERHGDHHDPYH